MITEDRIRAALREATASVEVDEDLAWQRAWLGVARQPARRVRRTSAAFAVAASVAVSVLVLVLAWQLFAGSDNPPSVVSGDTATAPAAEAPTTLFDQLRPNDEVGAAEWIDAANALASARGNVAGTIALENASVARSEIAFSADRDGQFQAISPLRSVYGVAAVTLMVDSQLRVVQIEATSESRGGSPVSTPPEVVVADPTVDHVLRPGAWLAQEIAGQEATITFLGRSASSGRAVHNFRVEFASNATYSEAGWDIALDARTGVVLSSVVRYAETGSGGTESVSVKNFTDTAPALRINEVILPGGYRIAAAVGNGADSQMINAMVPAGGASIGAVLDQVREAAK